MLAVQHAREQHARVGDQIAPRLAQQPEPRRAYHRDDCVGECFRRRRLLVVIPHAEPTAHVERLERRYAERTDRGDQLDELDSAAMVGRDIGDLRADVHRQPAEHEPRLGSDPLGDRHDFVEGNPELGGLFAGLGIGVAVDRDVGVDPNPDPGRQLAVVRDGGERRQLAGRFDVDEADARANRLFDLTRGLAHAGKHDAVGIEPRDAGPAQLSHGHDVGAGAELLQNAKDAEIAVGFDGVADAMPDTVERVVERVVLRANQVGAVDVGRRPDAIRDCLEQSRIES